MNIRIQMTVASLVLALSMPAIAAGPAARVGDTTSHGGTITNGSPTVLIGSLPAARVGDFATSPLVNGDLVPCFGGPIVGPGSPTVLINGLHAARVGDVGATACGLTQTIVTGAPTVIIGP